MVKNRDIRMNCKASLSPLAVALVGMLAIASPARASERMVVYSEKNIVSGITPAQCVTLQDGKFSTIDITQAYRIDLKAAYHITKIVYAGRTSAQCTQRMRGAQFKASLDGTNFTTFHTVPSDYEISLTDPVMTTVDLTEAGVWARFLDISGIANGSVSEIQFWTDTDIINVSEVMFSGESPEGADYSVSADVEGDLAEDASYSLTLYVASSDLGDDLSAWEFGAAAYDGGTRQGLGTWTGRVPAVVAGGMNYVRAAISAKAPSGETVVGFSPRVDVFSAANASNRMLVYSEKNVMSGLDAEKCKKLQDGQFSYGDITEAFRIDIQAEYRITKIVYAGRPSALCTQRMRGVKFKASLDGTNFTTFHEVSQEYDISPDNPEMTTVTLLRDNVRARFIDVSGIGCGSVSEIQFWTDSDIVVMDNISFTQESATGADYSMSSRVDGNFAADVPVSLTLYVASTDLGTDLSAWQAGATAVDGGTILGGGVFTGHLQPVVAGGMSYVYAVVSAPTLSGSTVVTHSTRASSFSAVSYEENRPLTDTSDCRLKHYWKSDDGYLAFDGDDTTTAIAPYGGIDYGRPVRIDRVLLVTSGPNALKERVQISPDGWTWHTLLAPADGDPVKAVRNLTAPVVARYIRYSDDGVFNSNPHINEIRTYASSQAPYVALQDETAVRTTEGLSVKATVYGGNLPAGTPVTLRGYVADKDCGLDPAAWVAAGAVVVDLGMGKTGEPFVTVPMSGVPGELRYGCVAAVVDGAAACVGTAFPFTMRDEALLDITLDMVRAGGSSENVWRQGFFGNRNVIHVWDGNSNGKAVLSATRPYRITMVEWHDRLDYNCGGRAAAAKFWIYKTPGNLSDGVVIAQGSSAVGANVPAVRGNRWMTVPVVGTQEGYAIGIADAATGNGFFRFYGAKKKLGLMLLVQ